MIADPEHDVEVAISAEDALSPSAVAGVIEISRCLRVITITTAKPVDMMMQRTSPKRLPELSEPPTMIATPTSAAAIAIQVRGGMYSRIRTQASSAATNGEAAWTPHISPHRRTVSRPGEKA